MWELNCTPWIFLEKAGPVPHVLAEDAERTVAIASVSHTSGNAKITLIMTLFMPVLLWLWGQRLLWDLCKSALDWFHCTQNQENQSSAQCSTPLPSQQCPDFPKENPGACSSHLLNGQGAVLILQHPLAWTLTVELPDGCWGKNSTNIFCWFSWLAWRGQNALVQLWLM